MRTKYWPPYDTKYGLFLIVLWENYEEISHWLGLDDLFATSIPKIYDIFHNLCIKRSKMGHILYYMGGQYFVRTLYNIKQIVVQHHLWYLTCTRCGLLPGRLSATRLGQSREFSTVFAKYALMFVKQKLQMQWHSLLGDHGGLDQWNTGWNPWWKNLKMVALVCNYNWVFIKKGIFLHFNTIKVP